RQCQGGCGAVRRRLETCGAAIGWEGEARRAGRERGLEAQLGGRRMAGFLIRRPIVAIVISILMVIMGLFTLSGLSIEQYPFLAPPTIRVTATYPGASAVAVE